MTQQSNPVGLYLGKIQQELSTGHAQEHSYRPALKDLFETVTGLRVVNEPKGCAPAAPTEPDRTAAFSWSFEADDTLNPDGVPNTNIFLEATYSDGDIRREMIDTVPSSCNALPDSDVIQCYGAGLGYRFKVTKGDDSYLVQRQEFEEGTPDVTPEPQDYETVTEFSL